MIQCPQSDFTVPCPEIFYCCASAGQRCGQKQGNGEAVRDTVGFGFSLHDHFAVGHKISGGCKHLFSCSWVFTEKAMAPHSRTLAWKIPWMEEPGRLQSMGSLSRTRQSDFTFAFHFLTSEKEMATHSNVLAWRIPGTGEPGGLPSMESHRVGHN